MAATPIHPSSLISPTLHSPALTELLEAHPKYSRTLIRYVVEKVIETVRVGMDVDAYKASRGRSAARDDSPESLERFILRVLYMSETRVPILLVALVYIERAKAYLRISQNAWAHERVFMGALIVAHKYLNDISIKNRHWSSCTGIFSPKDVSRIEREFLEVLDFELGFTESDILYHYAPLMALTSLRHHTPHLRAQTPLREPSSPSTSSPYEMLFEIEDLSDSEDGSSCGSSSPPTTPQDVDTDASSSYVNIPSHPHSPIPSTSTPPLTYRHPMSAAIRILHAFPMPVHHVSSHRVQVVKAPSKRTHAQAVHPYSSSSSSGSSPSLSPFSPISKAHHDSLALDRYQRGLY
ncbi:hypothetical protein BXZ70DRAFT_650534 [Cristinia sonorae]|uniref:Cyclin N-terminal domain-containing protein n=1 Tax=Cristinia sonorae TaxID=1940300 RepID=A0A8K0UG57_9AGAR|nr:hypothetical protein BXZ70DRAFT_650534 [Cristinia sonorae]